MRPNTKTEIVTVELMKDENNHHKNTPTDINRLYNDLIEFLKLDPIHNIHKNLIIMLSDLDIFIIIYTHTHTHLINTRVLSRL